MGPGEAVSVIFATLIALTVIITLGITVHHARKARHLERMAMIEKGMHPDDFSANKNYQGILVPRWMRFSSTMAGIGTGLLVAGVLDSWFPSSAEEPLYFGSILLMGGVGLGAPYFLSAYFQTHSEDRDAQGS